MKKICLIGIIFCSFLAFLACSNSESNKDGSGVKKSQPSLAEILKQDEQVGPEFTAMGMSSSGGKDFEVYKISSILKQELVDLDGNDLSKIAKLAQQIRAAVAPTLNFTPYGQAYCEEVLGKIVDSVKGRSDAYMEAALSFFKTKQDVIEFCAKPNNHFGEAKGSLVSSLGYPVDTVVQYYGNRIYLLSGKIVESDTGRIAHILDSSFDDLITAYHDGTEYDYYSLEIDSDGKPAQNISASVNKATLERPKQVALLIYNGEKDAFKQVYYHSKADAYKVVTVQKLAFSDSADRLVFYDSFIPAKTNVSKKVCERIILSDIPNYIHVTTKGPWNYIFPEDEYWLYAANNPAANITRFYFEGSTAFEDCYAGHLKR